MITSDITTQISFYWSKLYAEPNHAQMENIV